MPVYEYQCQSCRKKVSLLIGMVSRPDEEKCPHCGSLDLNKLVSRFRRMRSDNERMDEISDRLENMGEPESPSQVRALVKEMAKATDEDMEDDLEEILEADLEQGPGAEELD